MDNTTGNEVARQHPCGCGRSPTGFCIGWHSLTTEEYAAKLKEINLNEQQQLLREDK